MKKFLRFRLNRNNLMTELVPTLDKIRNAGKLLKFSLMLSTLESSDNFFISVLSDTEASNEDQHVVLYTHVQQENVENTINSTELPQEFDLKDFVLLNMGSTPRVIVMALFEKAPSENTSKTKKRKNQNSDASANG